jgi:hypothetical protein
MNICSVLSPAIDRTALPQAAYLYCLLRTAKVRIRKDVAGRVLAGRPEPHKLVAVMLLLVRRAFGNFDVGLRA